MKNGKAVTIEGTGMMGTPEDLEEIKQSEQQLDAILGADFTNPTTLKLKYNYSSHNRAHEYYKSIADRLRQWWDDFSNELDLKSGGPRYRNVVQFARSRTRNREEQEWIIKMIGPEPSVYNSRHRGRPKWLRVPWLGDWKQRRANGYWAPDQPERVKSLVSSLKGKLQGLEAVRSAAPFLVQEMARYTRMAEQIDEAFGGQALNMSKGPMAEDNKARFYAHLEMQKAVTRVKLRLLHEWMLVHGVNPANPAEFIEVNNNLIMAAGISPSQALNSMADSTTEKDIQAIKLARMLQLHSENFAMPLPNQPPPKEQEKPATKGNGKVM